MFTQARGPRLNVSAARSSSGEFDGFGLDVLAERFEHLSDDSLSVESGAGRYFNSPNLVAPKQAVAAP